MPQIEFSELPGDLRVRLTEEGEKKLWNSVDEFGGIKMLSDSSEFSQSGMYNWKNKELALPVEFVRRLMSEDSADEIVLMKGKGSSNPIESPDFPLKLPRELLTRIEHSVSTNEDGTPVYRTGEISLLKRFAQLLDEAGKVPYSVYSRESGFELRYPAYFHRLLTDISFEEDFAAAFDESGRFEEREMVLKDERLPVEDFESDLFSRRKKYRLAVIRSDQDILQQLISDQVRAVDSLLDS